MVTKQGRRVARLTPEGDSLHERLEMLKKAGIVLWSGRPLGRAKPAGHSRGTRTLSDIVVENRE